MITDYDDSGTKFEVKNEINLLSISVLQRNDGLNVLLRSLIGWF